MANPRKFSEKIALHNLKQAEETAEFEKIMREVSDATNKSVLSNLEEMQQQKQPVLRGASDGGGAPLFINQGVPRERGRSLGGGAGGGGGSGGPMRSRGAASCDKRMDALPYYTAGGPYLSPPPADPNWRRTNSDSALHQSSGQGGGGGAQEAAMRSPGAHRRVHYNPFAAASFGLDGHGQYDGQMYEPTRTRHVSVSPDGRPKSCEVPRVNIYPSQQEPGIVQIPIGNNTGSLPDLTSFHFPSPLPTPIDQEDHSSSPYSNSPQGTSPSTLSPTSLPPRQTNRFSYGGSPPNESPGPPSHYSPLSPSTPNHLSVPHSNSRFLHNNKGVKLENSVDTSSYSQQSPRQHHHHHQQSSPQQQQQQQQHHHQSPQNHHHHHHQQQQQQQQQFIYHSASSPQSSSQPPLSPQHPHSPQTTPPTSMNVVNSLSYRSPQPISRPSPRNSPGLNVDYGSTSPICSSPQSPLSPASSTTVPSFAEHNNFIFTQAQANALEQHFQQFNMMDSPGSGNIDFISSANAMPPYSQSDDNCGQELTPDPGYFSTSPSQQLQYCGGGNTTTAAHGHNTSSAHTTPNTPSSIPDIVLTDFSSPGDDLGLRERSEEFAKELGSAINVGIVDSSDMFADECLREGLDPIDLDGLQMLTDQEVVITDPATEDHFRLDRL